MDYEDRVRERLEDVISRASVVADMWAGTLYEKQIEVATENLEKAIRQSDLEQATDIACHLEKLTEQAEKEYEIVS